jgi:hypothetical protein
MATHFPTELVPAVRMPWPSFLVEVPDGEHRLSRPEDIAVLFELIGQCVAPA